MQQLYTRKKHYRLYMKYTRRTSSALNTSYFSFEKSVDNFCDEMFGYKPAKLMKYVNNIDYICFYFDTPEDAAIFKLTWF